MNTSISFFASFLVASLFFTSSHVFADDEEREAKKFFTAVESAFNDDSKQLPVNFFDKKFEGNKAEFSGECGTKSERKNKKTKYTYDGEEVLVFLSKKKFGDSEFYYGTGEDFDGTADTANGEKYTAAFLDKNQDLVQDTVTFYGQGQGSDNIFERVGRTYLRAGTFKGKKAYLFVHKMTTFKERLIEKKEQIEYEEIYCYFSRK